MGLDLTAFFNMPQPPKKRKRGTGRIHCKKGMKKKKATTTPSALLKDPPKSSISSPPATRKRPPPAFVSPQRKQPKRTTSTTAGGGLPVQELLEIFTQLEGLEGVDLKAAIVHGRKNLQAMANQGRSTTDVSTAVEMPDDSTTATGAGATTINSATGGPPTELQQHLE